MSRWLFACLGLGLTLIGSFLLVLALRAAAAPGTVPPEISAHFSPDDVARGRAYMDGRYWLFAAGMALRLAVLLCLVLTPASASLRNLAVRLSPAYPGLAVVIYIAMLALGFELLMLPLGFYSSFIREHAFGLSTQTAAAWFADRAKGALIALVLAVPMGSVLVLLWRRYPGRWVFPAWTLGALVVIFLVALAPVVIDPLFNTIRPVQDSALRQRVLTLAQRAGIPVQEVYETDASRRTRKGNAYFTGIGATKRIVLYDTLIAKSDPEAVDLVLAHEMGHWANAHIWKGIALTVVGIGAALWCGARALAWTGARQAFHLAGPADVAALPLFLLVMFLLSLASLPLQSAVSRYFERQADLASLELTRNPAAFIRAEVDLARSNLADLNPPRLIVWILYTHPPVAERIRMAESFGKPVAASSP